VLEARLRAPTTEQRQVFRARIVLLATEGRSTRSIARELRTMPRTVSGWRGRFAREGLAGLEDRPHPGPAPKYGSATGRRILALLDEPPPNGYARWTGPLLAEALGDVHEQQVWRFLRIQKIDLRGVNPGAKATIPNSPPKPPM
jgi:transposase